MQQKNFTQQNALKPRKIGENLTSRQIGEKSLSADYISERTGLSVREIQRLIRIAKLSDQLLAIFQPRQAAEADFLSEPLGNTPVFFQVSRAV